MSLKEQLTADLKAALKAGDETRKNAIRALQAAIKQSEVDRQTTLTDDDVLALIQKEAKSRRESIADAQKAGRADLVAAYEAELAVMEAYLPQPLSRDELIALAKAAIAEAGATGIKQQGAVMKLLAPRIKGRADGKLVGEIVRELLS
ncbi:MAG: GatB/YqeY domain-containing protein [Anaerolineales bacterium]|nr:GatB/YqeY domain-containing protein [Anaerolineales bacterium]